MECRYKEKIAGSNQSLKVEGKTHRFLVVPLVPSSVCRGCSHVWSPNEISNSNHSKKRKVDQVSAPEGMFGSESALGAFWGMMQLRDLKVCLGPETLNL